MHLKIRISSTKARKMKGFRRKMKTRSGRAIINRQRRRSIGKGKRKTGVLRKKGTRQSTLNAHKNKKNK